MPDTNRNATLEWRIAIEKSLNKQKSDVCNIPYQQVSLAFPGGQHESSFDIQCIDSKSLQSWAKGLGWSVCMAPEITYPSQKNTPWIRFSRII